MVGRAESRIVYDENKWDSLLFKAAILELLKLPEEFSCELHINVCSSQYPKYASIHYKTTHAIKMTCDDSDCWHLFSCIMYASVPLLLPKLFLFFIIVNRPIPACNLNASWYIGVTKGLTGARIINNFPLNPL